MKRHTKGQMPGRDYCLPLTANQRKLYIIYCVFSHFGLLTEVSTEENKLDTGSIRGNIQYDHDS